MLTKVHSSAIDWTAIGAIGTWVAALAIPVSAVLVLLQLRQAKDATQSQVYQILLDRAERIRLNDALDAVRDLSCTTFPEFLHLAPEARGRTRLVVEFFNEIQHMLETRMLDLRYVERLWGQSILNCTERLWNAAEWDKDVPDSWWLAGIREKKGMYFYRGFEQLCWTIKCRDLAYRIARGEVPDHGRVPDLEWKKGPPEGYW
jgi:hypothetical protein